MPRSNQLRSRGEELAERLQRGCQLESSALRNGARNIPILSGVTMKCEFLKPQENVLAEFGTILVTSQRTFRYGNSIVIENRDGDRRKLAILATDRRIHPATVGLLANLVVCANQPVEGGNPNQFPVPRRLVELILNHEPTLERLPTIQTYSNRPLFDAEFQLRGPGWHPDVGYLIHGPDIETIMPQTLPSSGAVIDRLPRRLRELLSDFSFKSATDLVNAVGALLTGLLVTRFVSVGKAIFVLDGNQPSVGKTLFGRVLGMLLSGIEPAPIKYTTDDEELGKKICANLRGHGASILLFDNAKIRAGAIESAVIEANSTAPQISLRILGESANHEQPNDMLWVITMNNTRLGADLAARSCPIRFHFDGDPNTRRTSHRDLIQFVRNHRLELLDELAGMVVAWNQQGRPPGTPTHRLGEWACTIGGILNANGLPGFLDNLEEASGEFNTALDQFVALAEAAVSTSDPSLQRVVHTLSEPQSGNSAPADWGLPAGELIGLFRRANVLTERLEVSKSLKSRSTTIGRFLSQYINRTVTVEMPSRPGQTASRDRRGTLRVIEDRSRTKRYWFEICWICQEGPPEGDECSRSLGELHTPMVELVISPIPDAAELIPPTSGCGNSLAW